MGRPARRPRLRVRPFSLQSEFLRLRRRAFYAEKSRQMQRSLTAPVRTARAKSGGTAPKTRTGLVWDPTCGVFQDCLVRDPVLTEPVSGAKFPVQREFAGNFVRFGHQERIGVPPTTWFCPVIFENSLLLRTGNLFDGSGKISSRTGWMDPVSGQVLQAADIAPAFVFW